LKTVPSSIAYISAASALRCTVQLVILSSSAVYTASFAVLLVSAAVETFRLVRLNWPNGALSCLYTSPSHSRCRLAYRIGPFTCRTACSR